jgi:8-oxo-dGTP pyrophosphatase MutT (NUDIX family)
MASSNLGFATRHSDVAYVLAKLRVRGVDHLLLHAHRKWGDWSLVGGHVESTDADWLAAASREVQEEMAPLRCGEDIEVEALPVPETEWGPVSSVSAGGVATSYRARWYLLRFKQNPGRLLDRLPKDEFSLIPIADPGQFEMRSTIVDRAKHLLGRWQELPLSWESDLVELPLPSSTLQARHA